MNRHTARIEDLASTTGSHESAPACWSTVAAAFCCARQRRGAAGADRPEQSRRLTAIEPHQVATLRSVGTVELSPDGSLAAYLLAVPRRPLDEDSGSSWTELHVLDMSEPGASRPYITGELNVGRPTFRGNDEVLYTARREPDKTSALYGIPLGGGESRKLVEHAVGIGSYVLSPDGSRIAFLAREETDEGHWRSSATRDSTRRSTKRTVP